ncbi:lipopolysaccharide kinase InaA family protein [Zooshikella sp. RANM57]|uniref:lipopolysaccharide kinase InaA family protein n=1 Tax=Zooshikella sp. RANM57 TaxID=3425863 RepID=UPI003D70237F
MISTQFSSFSFEDWWQCKGAWVEPPNRRRGGESGVQRLLFPEQVQLYCKRQQGHLYHSFCHPFGRPTILREWHALHMFQRIGIQVPRTVYCSARKYSGQWQALLITEPLAGFISLEAFYQQPLERGQREKVLHAVAKTLRHLHLARWQHGCCYPKHIFVKAQPNEHASNVQVALLDLEKSRQRLTVKKASTHDLRQLFRHSPYMAQKDEQYFLKCYFKTVMQPRNILEKKSVIYDS